MSMMVYSLLFIIISLVLCLRPVSAATPSTWEGSYPDPVYGGTINVCVTDVNCVYYGQALFSNVGYMRGTIDASSLQWTALSS